ncbi:SDR family oxidoreductase [Streptacidiphilus sp. P02-A3a]|nr:SDR family oxidoreductase [Streptacidiphilus sp. P02-A3a]
MTEAGGSTEPVRVGVAAVTAPLLARRDGAIVNVSSNGAGPAMGDYTLVGVYKPALEALTRYLAADLDPPVLDSGAASP